MGRLVWKYGPWYDFVKIYNLFKEPYLGSQYLVSLSPTCCWQFHVRFFFNLFFLLLSYYLCLTLFAFYLNSFWCLVFFWVFSVYFQTCFLGHTACYIVLLDILRNLLSKTGLNLSTFLSLSFCRHQLYDHFAVSICCFRLCSVSRAASDRCLIMACIRFDEIILT